MRFMEEITKPKVQFFLLSIILIAIYNFYISFNATYKSLPSDILMIVSGICIMFSIGLFLYKPKKEEDRL